MAILSKGIPDAAIAIKKPTISTDKRIKRMDEPSFLVLKLEVFCSSLIDAMYEMVLAKKVAMYTISRNTAIWAKVKEAFRIFRGAVKNEAISSNTVSKTPKLSKK